MTGKPNLVAQVKMVEQIVGLLERTAGMISLVAVTIIKTVTVDATPEALGLLAVMIGIRTMLSWTTVLEMSGRWPWQRAPARSS